MQKISKPRLTVTPKEIPISIEKYGREEKETISAGFGFRTRLVIQHNEPSRVLQLHGNFGEG